MERIEERMETVYPCLTECAAEASRVAAAVKPDRLDAASGCGDWDVRALVNHWVAYTGTGMEHRARREPLPDDLGTRDFTGDPDWADRYAQRLERAVAAWSEPAVWEGEVELGFARQPAPEVASLLWAELVLHGWDVARATGQEFRVSDGAAALLLSVVDKNAAMYRQYEGFADPVELPDGAPVYARALALSGRDPRPL
ncbi:MULTISPECIES: TIGR03086 family metal-binding protein [unclassified Streptomyces]|uniref:TIGR03086 family metal-binding protein n=1 Tax=unclassified Streptomyces TaxID=2593676 RepID=UPI0005BB5F98|nr:MULTISPECIES: TIGR03086 family metal-binding protein [unclassified Streptomyces]